MAQAKILNHRGADQQYPSHSLIPSLYLNHTAIPSFAMAYTYSRYVYKLFPSRRSVLTGFIKLVQLLFRFRPFWLWPSLYLNHTAIPSFAMACTYSRYVYKLFPPCHSVLTGFIELVQLLFHFALFGPGPHSISSTQLYPLLRWDVHILGMYISYFHHVVLY